jgi:membrane protein DedA with SNARE-associated domain
MTIFLSSLFQHILSFLLLYKYFGLFIVAFASSVALPIPASATLAAAGGFASQGFLNIYAVLGITLFGSITGDMLDYILARKYGEKVLNRFVFFRRLIRSKAYHNVENYIVDFAPSLIFFSRFLTELSPATNLLAGLSKVSYKSFFMFALLGEATYTVLYGMAGYFLGAQWQNNISFVLEAGGIILSIGIAVNLIQVLLYRHRKQKV